MSDIRNSEKDSKHFRLRALTLGFVVLLAFSLVVMRLWYLQVLRHDDFADQAESNRTAVVPIVPSRGEILDRNGVVLATNYSAYTLEIMPSKVADLEETVEALGAIVEIHPRDKRRFKRLLDESRNFESLPIRTRLTDEEVARFTAQRWRFPGVDVKARLFRIYPQGEVGSHAIGYIGRINQKEKERIEDSEDAANYRGTEYIGKLGIEQSYEKQLHGTTGVELLETSAGGRAVRKLSSHSATPGDSVMLSLDIKLQKMVEDLFGPRRGALVAIDPRNGEILALVSKPTFDPNLFVEGIDQENWQALNESINKPLLNRALRGTYPPGSTYKPFMALAALQLGKRAATTVINDPGYYSFGGRNFRSHEGGLGGVDMVRAIQFSSNTYFYSLGVEMGVDTIHDFMAPLGFGQITGIDLGGELRGVLPSQAWKRKTYKRREMQRWFAGETVSLGIGQGYNNFTMLQLALAQATLGNGGTRYRPHLGKAVKDVVTGTVTALEQPAGQNLGYASKNVDVVRKGLVAVNEAGTGRRVFAGAAYNSAGKTGTAQAVSLGQNVKYNAKALEEHKRDHSLFAAFAPAENPQIAVAIIVENAGFGAASAAPIVRRVFDYWLAGQYPSEEDMAATAQGQTGAPIGKPRPVSSIAPFPPEATQARAALLPPPVDTASEPAPTKPIPSMPPATPMQQSMQQSMQQ